MLRHILSFTADEFYLIRFYYLIWVEVLIKFICIRKGRQYVNLH